MNPISPFGANWVKKGMVGYLNVTIKQWRIKNYTVLDSTMHMTDYASLKTN